MFCCEALAQRETTRGQYLRLISFYCSVKYHQMAVMALILDLLLGGKSPPAATQTLVSFEKPMTLIQRVIGFVAVIKCKS